jgi:hypothetical protein
MKYILLTLLMMSPYIIEVAVETYYEKVKKVSLSHPWTMAVRALIMVGIGIVFAFMKWSDSIYEPIILMIAIHFALFSYTYNFITGRKWTYLRDGGLDKAMKRLHPFAILFAQVWLLTLGIVVYYYGVRGIIEWAY